MVGKMEEDKEKQKTKEELLNDIMYCLLGAKSAHYERNYGEEDRWLRHVYNYCDDYQEYGYDL